MSLLSLLFGATTVHPNVRTSASNLDGFKLKSAASEDNSNLYSNNDNSKTMM